MAKPKLRCYVCGGKIKLSDIFFLATPSEQYTDRVFLVCDAHEGHSCLHRLDKDNKTLNVKGNDMRYL